MATASPPTRRTLGAFDATMIVMGGIVGVGVFMNPYVVAQRVHSPGLILGVWLAGGAIAMLGAFIWAELATRVPAAGGQYRYLREAYHPAIAFLYGWVLLLVTQTGGMAAVAVTFARYLKELTGLAWSDACIAGAALLTLTAVNCLGVRAGSNTQTALMLLKSAAIGILVFAGFAFVKQDGIPAGSVSGAFAGSTSMGGDLGAIAAAMIPIGFAYGGWQTASFLASEMRDPKRDLSRGLVMGVAGVVALYLAVNFVCVRALGPTGLAATPAPATAVMRAAFGDNGARWIALGIAVSALGFLSQGILTAPRVYYAMARDGLFFEQVGRLSERTGAPVAAIVLQGIAATAIALCGVYEQILNYVVSIDFVLFGATAASLFVFRARGTGGASEAGTGPERPLDQPCKSTGPAATGSVVPTDSKGFRVPGHPWTTALFVLACVGIVAATVVSYPTNSVFGWLILASGVPVYFYWSRAKS